MITIELATIIAAPIERCFDLSRSIEVHLLGTRKTGEEAVGGVTTGLIGPGQFVRWRARHFGVWQHLASRITEYDRPAYFQDTMIEGAFRFMQHDHRFESIAPNVTKLTDRMMFAAPLPLLGAIAERFVLKRYMENLLRERDLVLKHIAESDRWLEFLPCSGER